LRCPDLHNLYFDKGDQMKCSSIHSRRLPLLFLVGYLLGMLSGCSVLIGGQDGKQDARPNQAELTSLLSFPEYLEEEETKPRPTPRPSGKRKCNSEGCKNGKKTAGDGHQYNCGECQGTGFVAAGDNETGERSSNEIILQVEEDIAPVAPPVFSRSPEKKTATPSMNHSSKKSGIFKGWFSGRRRSRSRSSGG
jgi:hypothetical protein